MTMYLSTQDVATRLGVHEETVRRWLRAGELRGIPLGRAGYRISEEDLQQFLRARLGEAPIPTTREGNASSAHEQTRDAVEAELARLRAALAQERAARIAAEALTQRTEAIFEAITDGIFIVDARGIPLINHAARVMLCVPADAPASYPSIPPFTMHDVTSRAIIPREQWPQTQLFAGHAIHPSQSEDVLLRTVDGRERQINITGAPLPNDAGDINSVVVVCRDVTERRQLEQRTQNSLTTLLTMAEEMTRLPGTIDTGQPEGEMAQHLVELMRQVLSCQRAALTIIDPETHAFRSAAVAGISPEEELLWRERRPGTVLRDYLHRQEMDERLRAEGAVVLDLTQPPWNSTPAPYGIQSMLLVALSIEERIVGVLVLDYDGTMHRFTTEEVTLAKAVAKLAALVLERERLLRERAAALVKQEALRAANQRMDDFLSIASHELRTPLTTIKMSLQLLTRRAQRLESALANEAPERVAQVSDMEHLLTRAETQADRQTRLLSDLLDATRIQAGKMSYLFAPCDLLPILRESIAEASNMDPRRQITFTGDPSPCIIEADADRISQVIMNLLSNALKYSATDTPVAITLERHNGAARITVQDHGRGLSPEAQAHIWERFYRVAEGKDEANAVDGLGLGLFICRTIITAHGGEVSVQSAEGIGSTFWFTLPIISPIQPTK